MYRCQRCQHKVVATKRLTIHRAPAVLTIHLKRFQFVQLYGGEKIGKPITFTEQLNLAAHMSFVCILITRL